MNATIKRILRQIGIYHLLQSFYREQFFNHKKFWLRQVYSKYKSSGFICNYCDSSYSKFAPWFPDAANKEALQKNHVIAGYGENMLCPNCLSTARERLLKAIATSDINFSQKSVLHISPERYFYRFIKQSATVITVDYTPAFYQGIDSHIQFADATQLSFANDLFDIVVGNHIMEHIPDDLQAMREIFRVLKPGGLAILQVPFSTTLAKTIEMPELKDSAKQSELFGQHDHVRIYALQDYQSRLRKTGFIVNYKPHELLADFYKYAIQKDEGFFFIEKRQ